MSNNAGSNVVCTSTGPGPRPRPRGPPRVVTFFPSLLRPSSRSFKPAFSVNYAPISRSQFSNLKKGSPRPEFRKTQSTLLELEQAMQTSVITVTIFDFLNGTEEKTAKSM